MKGPNFEMKSVALSFAIILCTLCHEVLLLNVHQLEASGCAWKTCPPFPVNGQGRPCECALAPRMSDAHYRTWISSVLIRFKVLK